MKYRSNVAAILRNAAGQILICERLGVPGAWQFPQGGIDDGETPEQALVRELWEEIGVQPADVQLLRRCGPYRYEFGNGRMKKGFHGKEQLYFLCEYSGKDAAIDVNTEHPEFQDFRWIAPEEFQIGWLPEMKRQVYSEVFVTLFGIQLQRPA